MKTSVNRFLHRGLIFGGFGPIVVGIVYIILQHTVKGFSLTGTQVCLAIVSTYLLAFVQAGATVFNQIEEWSIPKSLLCHFSVLYVAYVLCYLVNTWIPFRAEVILVFTAIFIVAYFVIWFSVYFAVKATRNKLNKTLA